MAPPTPPPELNPDAVFEILLRLPPDALAGLVRASAVCKPWLWTLTDPAFLRRYRDFHGTPLVLGFLHNPTDRSLAHFVPTTAFRPHTAAAAAHRTCSELDCRHGRALLYDYHSTEFVVWDPVTGRESRILDEEPDVYTNHAVLWSQQVRGAYRATLNLNLTGGRVPHARAGCTVLCRSLWQVAAVWCSELAGPVSDRAAQACSRGSLPSPVETQ